MRSVLVRGAGMLLVLAAAIGLLPSVAGAEPSRHEHEAAGRIVFQCAQDEWSLRIAGSEADGFQAVVQSAQVGGTRYYTGLPAPTEVAYQRGRCGRRRCRRRSSGCSRWRPNSNRAGSRSS